MKKIMGLFFKIALGIALFSGCRFISVQEENLGSALGDLTITGNSGKKITAEGLLETRSYYITDFNELSLSSFMDVHYETTDGDASLEVKTYENIFDYLDIQCTDGKLEIKMKEGHTYNVRSMDIYVRSKTLSTVKLAGAGDIHIKKGLVTDNFDLSLAGAGDIDIEGLKADKVKVSIAGAGDADIEELECNDIKVSIAGAGDITLSGKTCNADFSIAGAGKIDASSLEAENVKKNTSGIGSIIL